MQWSLFQESGIVRGLAPFVLLLVIYVSQQPPTLLVLLAGPGAGGRPGGQQMLVCNREGVLRALAQESHSSWLEKGCGRKADEVSLFCLLSINLPLHSLTLWTTSLRGETQEVTAQKTGL